MVIFKSKQKKFEDDLKIKFCGKRLYPTESVKYLGVNIDTNLSWQYYVIIEIPQESIYKKLLTLIITIITVVTIHLLTVDKKRFHIIWTKEANENQPKNTINHIFASRLKSYFSYYVHYFIKTSRNIMR